MEVIGKVAGHSELRAHAAIDLGDELGEWHMLSTSQLGRGLIKLHF